VTLVELAAAYAPFANGGLRVTPFAIQEARSEGRPVAVPRTRPERVVEARHAQAIRRMLDQVVARGTGRAAQPPGGRAVAGKTGTTQDFRDAWFIGIAGPASNPLVIGVWLGNDDATPTQDVRGGTLPARLFRDIVEGWLADPRAATARAPAAPG
jgi:penicillin-binding protein 1A